MRGIDEEWRHREGKQMAQDQDLVMASGSHLCLVTWHHGTDPCEKDKTSPCPETPQNSNMSFAPIPSIRIHR
jgi:hypothetical protein